MNVNFLISFIFLLFLVLVFTCSNKEIKENFNTLSDTNKNELSHRIRNIDKLSDTIDQFADQINTREKDYKSIERQYKKKNVESMNNYAPNNWDKSQGTVNNSKAKQIAGQTKESQKAGSEMASAENGMLKGLDMSEYVHKSTLPNMNKYILAKKVEKNFIKKDNLPDMDKYILRTQVPVPVNLNKYILRSQVPQCPKMPDMSKFIRKTSVAPAMCEDMSRYVLKTTIPAACISEPKIKGKEGRPTCPVCPKSTTTALPKLEMKNGKLVRVTPEVSPEVSPEILPDITSKVLPKTRKVPPKAKPNTIKVPPKAKPNTIKVPPKAKPKTRKVPPKAKPKTRKVPPKAKPKTRKVLPKVTQKKTVVSRTQVKQQPKVVSQKTQSTPQKKVIEKKQKEIKKVIKQYKPKIVNKKCNLFHRVIKNADVYGAY
jgi:hypothetical protein